MRRGTVTLIFFCSIWAVLSTIVFPPFFRFFNRIDPWVIGLPFVQFWILLVVLAVCILLTIWYKVEEKRGELE
nr:DUF3311 domain-containing protein [Bacillus norwichensis]